MKRIASLWVVATLVTLLTAGSALASTPPGLENGGEPWVCNDTESVVFGGSGRSGWVDGTLYQGVEFSGTFTFTPTDGSPVVQTFTKAWGKGPKGGVTVVCTASDSGSDSTGSWAWEATVTAVRVPGH